MSPGSYLSSIKKYYRKNLLVLAGVTLYYKNGLRYIDIYSFRKRYSGVCMCVFMYVSLCVCLQGGPACQAPLGWGPASGSAPCSRGGGLAAHLGTLSSLQPPCQPAMLTAPSQAAPSARCCSLPLRECCLRSGQSSLPVLALPWARSPLQSRCPERLLGDWKYSSLSPKLASTRPRPSSQLLCACFPSEGGGACPQGTW